MMAFLPFFTFEAADINIDFAKEVTSSAKADTISIEDVRAERAAKIDAYYNDRSMPLEGHGMKMVLEAEKYGIDWRLIPAIAVRESSGGKNACYNNPFGWGSCKIKFKSYEESIEALARNLGGANQKTASYYAGKSTLEKLYYYNGTVVPSYPKEVVKIMDKIGEYEINTELAVK